jgi:hypothetical protein
LALGGPTVKSESACAAYHSVNEVSAAVAMALASPPALLRQHGHS